MITEELEAAGQNIRKYYQRRLPSNPVKDYYYIIRDTADNETVIVEYGFADSTGDDVNQIKNDWQQLAEAVVKAITEYAGGNYVAPEGSLYHTVKAGESLWSIANKYGVTVDELKDVNNLQSNLISIGQNLIIPGEEEVETGDKVTYTVKKGDSLWAIANMYGTTVDNLKDINNLSSNNLQIGQVLVIKEGASDVSGNTYTVKKGDSLWSIAQKYNTNVDTLKSLNNLSTSNLSIGQILKLPTNNEYETYIVKKGDNLYAIARENGTTVSAIVELNNLSTTALSIGQKLLLP